MAYTDNELLNLLREYTEKIGRTPYKDDIDSNPNMPSSSTYLERFGGVSKALVMIGKAPNRHSGLSVDYFINEIRRYYNEYGVVPNSKDFDDNPMYPHSSFLRDGKYTWVEAIRLSGLPLYTRGETWIKCRETELKIKAILSQSKHTVIDLKENTTKKGSFLVNDIIVRTRTSQLYSTSGKKNISFGWKFKIHKNDVVNVGYYICVGLNSTGDIEAIFVIPSHQLTVSECISINSSNIQKSKYGLFKVSPEELLDYDFV